MTLRFTLVSEGSSDRALLPLVRWSLRQHSEEAFSPQWADLRKVKPSPRSLSERIELALELYPCDLLFVHRDGDRAGREKRVEEIHGALRQCPAAPAVCLIPVRALEAWLLFDEPSIRKAAGNPNGTVPVSLPRLREIEQLPNPKKLLANTLETASGLSGRRLRSFRTAPAVHRVSDLLLDFSPLRELPAFAAFENDLRRVLKENSW